MRERDVAILRALADDGDEQRRGLFARRVEKLAGVRGATATLDALARRKLVAYTFLRGGTVSRRWFITDAGRAALGEFAFGEAT